MTRRVQPVSIPVHKSRPGLVWPSAVDRDGLLGPTRGQSRTDRWRRTSSGYYLPADLDRTLEVEQRIVAAAWIVLGTGAVTGWAALRWLGATWLDERAVPIAVPRTGPRAQPGIVVSVERVDDHEVALADGLAITTPLRSVSFAARHAVDLVAAVNALDRAAAVDLVSIAEARAYAGRLAGASGISRLHEALGLAVENSWSPMETEMRLLWRKIGLVDVLCNTPVFDMDGRHVGTPDLLDPVRGVIGEYDGPHHLDGDRRASDIKREGAFRRVGLEYVEMVAADRRDPTDFLRRTTDAMGRVDPSRREWTLVAPSWWRRTETVEQRRALSPSDRARLLRWQR
jgi:hypothetical protein